MKAGIFHNMPFQYFNELYDAANIVKYFLSANFFLHLLVKLMPRSFCKFSLSLQTFFYTGKHEPKI
jgi:hypothetical protein